MTLTREERDEIVRLLECVRNGLDEHAVNDINQVIGVLREQAGSLTADERADALLRDAWSERDQARREAEYLRRLVYDQHKDCNRATSEQADSGAWCPRCAAHANFFCGPALRESRKCCPDCDHGEHPVNWRCQGCGAMGGPSEQAGGVTRPDGWSESTCRACGMARMGYVEAPEPAAPLDRDLLISAWCGPCSPGVCWREQNQDRLRVAIRRTAPASGEWELAEDSVYGLYTAEGPRRVSVVVQDRPESCDQCKNPDCDCVQNEDALAIEAAPVRVLVYRRKAAVTR